MLTAFRSICEDAGAHDAELLARQLLILKEGAIVAAHMGFDPDPARVARTAAEQLIALQVHS